MQAINKQTNQLTLNETNNERMNIVRASSTSAQSNEMSHQDVYQVSQKFNLDHEANLLYNNMEDFQKIKTV